MAVHEQVNSTPAELTLVTADHRESEPLPNGETLAQLMYERNVPTYMPREAVSALDPELSPYTLLSLLRREEWEPCVRTDGNHRRYLKPLIDQVKQLRDEGLSWQSAIREAKCTYAYQTKEVLAGRSGYTPVTAAEVSNDAADSTSDTGAITKRLLRLVRSIGEREEYASVHWGEAESLCIDWLLMHTPRAQSVGSVLIGNASEGSGSRDHLEISALKWYLARKHFNVVEVPIKLARGISDKASALDPRLVVIAGNRGGRETRQHVRSWISEVTAGTAIDTIHLFRHPALASRGQRIGHLVLPSLAEDAAEALMRTHASRPAAAAQD